MSRRIWITGAGKGIGRETARQYAAAGDIVAVSARTESDLATLAASAEGLPGEIHPFILDVTDAVAVATTQRAVEAMVGPLDLVILNAGTHQPMPAHEFSIETFRRLLDLNVMGTVHCLAAVLPGFLERRQGQIAVVASVAGYRGLPTAAAYGASKAALINMCEALYPELAQHGVRLTLVNPGFVRTPLTDRNDFPMPFLMEVGDAAARLIKGLEKGGFEVTFPRRFTWWLKLGRCLPYPLYFALTRRMARG